MIFKVQLLFIVAAIFADAFSGPQYTSGRYPGSRGIQTPTESHLKARFEAKRPEKDETNDKAAKWSMMDTMKKNPGTLVAAPFVVLIGIDLLLNIGVLAKRTVEYFAFGRLPSTDVWFSDNFFL